MNKISVPALLIYSKSDKLSKISYGTNLYEKISSTDKELFILKDSFHNIFNDIEKDKVFQKMLEFTSRLIK